MVPSTLNSYYGFRLGSWFQRLAAYFIDRMLACGTTLAVVFGLTVALFDHFYDPDDPGAFSPDSLWVEFTGLWGWYVTAGAGAVLFVYVVWFLSALRRGQTPGKQIVGLRVIRTNGEPSPWGYTFVREFIIQWLLVGIATVLTMGIFSLINYLWPLRDKNRQALHDKMAETLVVETRPVPAQPAEPAVPGASNQPAAPTESSPAP